MEEPVGSYFMNGNAQYSDATKVSKKSLQVLDRARILKSEIRRKVRKR